MKNYYLPLICLLLVSSVNAQQLFPSAYPRIVGSGNDTLALAFSGGLSNPQFANFDLNNNGINDLVVFDAGGHKLLTFLSNGNTTNPSFVYAPQYEELFPMARNFIYFFDYNKNGKLDFFTYSSLGGGVAVYKNTSTSGKIQFELYSEQLDYREPNYRTNLYVSNADFPFIGDIDNDGKLDVLSFSILGSYIEHYKNMSEDPEVLDFWIMDRCYGKIMEDWAGNVHLGVDCPRIVWKKNPFEDGGRHAGGTLLSVDIDGDGDNDLFFGEVEAAKIYLLINGRTQHGSSIDTMVSKINNWQQGGKEITLNFPVGFYVDVNNNKIKDLIFTPYERGGAENLNQIWLYRNMGTAANPNFVFVQEDFIQRDMLDLGGFTAPAFFDYNGNGLMDLVVATAGSYVHTFNAADRLVLYENIGTAEYPVYKLIDNDYLGLASQNMRGLSPVFADVTGNGKIDLLMGTFDGNLVFYRNTSINTVPQLTFETNVFAGLTPSSFSAPAIFDVDNDGKPDLLVGGINGRISYYRNIGSVTEPAYNLVTDSFGGIIVNQTFWEYTYDQIGQPIDSTLRYYPTGYSSPAIADANGDGIIELLVGSESGRVYVFQGIEANPSGVFTQIDNYFYDYGLEQGITKNFGYRSKPATADINNTGKTDLMVGSIRGGLHFYGSVNKGPDTLTVSTPKIIKPEALHFNVFPNPSANHFNISGLEKGKYTIVIYNLAGQRVFADEIIISEPVYEVLTRLNKGIYILELSNHMKAPARKKIVVE